MLEQIDALGRDGVIASAAIVALLIVAWTYLIWLFWSVPGIPGAQMAQTEFPFVFAMWAVMMVGMMTPSFTPTVLAYLQLGRHPVIRNQPLAPAGWLLAGYLLVWLIFAIIASAAQTALLEAHLITPTGS